MSLISTKSLYINTLVFNALSKCSDLMNLNGEDHKVYEYCLKDFWDYSDYLERNHYNENREDMLCLEDTQTSVNDFINMIMKLDEVSQNEITEVSEFINVWVQLWWKKWQYRTKIIFKDEPQMVNVGAHFSQVDISPDERKEIITMAIDKLIQYGEICCPSIFAENLFKVQSQQVQNKSWTIADKINFTSKMQREAKNLSSLSGPLLFLHINKEFLKIREYRDDANKVV